MNIPMHTNNRPTVIFFVRHGQTEWNKLRKVQGQIDIPLSEAGIMQAREVAQRLAGHAIDAIISSDLQRAAQTAAIINEYHKHTIKLEPLLREQHYGIAQGMLADEFPSRFQVTAKTLNQLEQEYSVPEAETYAQLVDRASRALHGIIEDHGGQTVLVVAHNSLMRSLIRHALNNHRLPVEIENCGIAHFHHDMQLEFRGFIGDGGKIGHDE